MPDPGPGVCAICRGPAAAGQLVCFACRLVARRLGLPLAPVVPVRLCPLPSPLYAVLLGYKESPVAEARLRFGAIVRALLRIVPRSATPAGSRPRSAARSTSSRWSRRPTAPGPAPLGARRRPRRATSAPPSRRARWAPALLRRADHLAGHRPWRHMRPDPAAFTVRTGTGTRPSPARGSLLLDDTYVSGARSQSAAAALRRAGARDVLIVPLGRVLRPDRIALHADFLRRHVA